MAGPGEKSQQVGVQLQGVALEGHAALQVGIPPAAHAGHGGLVALQVAAQPIMGAAVPHALPQLAPGGLRLQGQHGMEAAADVEAEVIARPRLVGTEAAERACSERHTALQADVPARGLLLGRQRGWEKRNKKV